MFDVVKITDTLRTMHDDTMRRKHAGRLYQLDEVGPVNPSAQRAEASFAAARRANRVAVLQFDRVVGVARFGRG